MTSPIIAARRKRRGYVNGEFFVMIAMIGIFIALLLPALQMLKHYLAGTEPPPPAPIPWKVMLKCALIAIAGIAFSSLTAASEEPVSRSIRLVRRAAVGRMPAPGAQPRIRRLAWMSVFRARRAPTAPIAPASVHAASPVNEGTRAPLCSRTCVSDEISPSSWRIRSSPIVAAT